MTIPRPRSTGCTTAAIVAISLTVGAGTASAGSAVSLDLNLRQGSRAVLSSGGSRVEVSRDRAGLGWKFAGRGGRVLRWGGSYDPGRIRVELLSAGSTVLALERTRLAVAGPDLTVSPAGSGSHSLRTSDRPTSLLLHRAAQLDSRTPIDHCLAAVTRATVFYVRDSRWDCGALTDWLWEAWTRTGLTWIRDEALRRGFAVLTAPAMQRGLAETHDTGSLTIDAARPAIELCQSGAIRDERRCPELLGQARSSVAAMMSLASLHPTGVLIRELPSRNGSQAIVDSLMNIPLLWWMAGLDQLPAAADLAARQARWVADNLVNESGSTFQAANFDRSGKLVSRTTLQGRRPDGVWARGQAWAVNGLAEAATLASGDDARFFAHRAELAAGWMLDHLGADGLPRWDLTAPAGDPVDLSSVAIAARGAALLSQACGGGIDCARPAAEWHSVGCLLLRHVLDAGSRVPPFGATFRQVDWKDHNPWGNDAELSTTALYALRADRLLGDCPPA